MNGPAVDEQVAKREQGVAQGRGHRWQAKTLRHDNPAAGGILFVAPTPLPTNRPCDSCWWKTIG